MKLPAIRGLIRRRMLVNFRADPEVVQRLLPPPLEPQRVGDATIVGVCLIRLEQVRPRCLPAPYGLQSENAAHRISVCWTDERGERHVGVYIPRRDTDSVLNTLAGGRLFPGEYHRARFDVCDEGGAIDFAMQSEDGQVAVRLRARAAAAFAPSSTFASLEEASDFFAAGSLGYSATSQGVRMDGIRLRTDAWRVEPLAVDSVYSSYFADETVFPAGSVEVDCALLMRNIPHEWESAPDLRTATRSAWEPQVSAT